MSDHHISCIPIPQHVSRSKADVGAIVGGVVGGVVGAIAIALILLFIMRRKHFSQTQKERPVDLLQDHDDGPGPAVGNERLPEYYPPEPFILPDPTVASTYESYRDEVPGGSSRPSGDRRQSYLSTSTSDAGGFLRAGTSLPSSSARKSPIAPSFRPVNIIQHDDAGPSEAAPEPETIELPPAYTNIKPRAAPPPSSVGADDGESNVGGASTVADSSADRPPHLL